LNSIIVVVVFKIALLNYTQIVTTTCEYYNTLGSLKDVVMDAFEEWSFW